MSKAQRRSSARAGSRWEESRARRAIVVVRVNISSLMGGAGQAVAHGRPDPRVDQARSVEKTEVGQHLAGQARVAHDVGRPGAEEGRRSGARPNRDAVAGMCGSYGRAAKTRLAHGCPVPPGLAWDKNQQISRTRWGLPDSASRSCRSAGSRSAGRRSGRPRRSPRNSRPARSTRY